MGDVINAKFGERAKLKAKKKRAKKNQRSSLCENGHHQWEVDKKTRFDTKQGKLVTVKRCKRCGIVKTIAE